MYDMLFIHMIQKYLRLWIEKQRNQSSFQQV